MDDDNRQLSSIARSKIIAKLIEEIHAHYIVPLVAEKMASMLYERQGRSEYEEISEGKLFAERLTAHIREVSQDNHLMVCYTQQEMGEQKTVKRVEGVKDMGAISNYGFEKVERLAGNIGYLGMQAFLAPAVAIKAVITSMDFIKSTNALIIDLRRASGGDPAMVQFFASYFFSSDPVHLSTMYWRADERTQQRWTLPYIPGHRYDNKPLSILVSRRTSAAAEEFAYALQSYKRALVIGETTAGEANALECFPLAPQFACWIPVEHTINPITGASWEGRGVQPDVEVAQENALKAAYTRALTHVLESNGHLQQGAQQVLEQEIREMLAQQI